MTKGVSTYKFSEESVIRGSHVTGALERKQGPVQEVA